MLEEMRRELTGQVWKEMSAKHWSGTWPSNSPVQCISTCVETLFRVQTLGFLSMAGRAASNRAGLRRKSQRLEGHQGEVRGVVVSAKMADDFANGSLYFAVDSWCRR